MSGTTCTRFRYLFEASLLTMTAGRSFFISPPAAGSQCIHHISPLFITHVPDGAFCPFQGLRLLALILHHRLVPRFSVCIKHMQPEQRCDEFTDAPTSDHPGQSLVDLFIKRNGQFPVPGSFPIRIAYVLEKLSRTLTTPLTSTSGLRTTTT